MVSVKIISHRNQNNQWAFFGTANEIFLGKLGKKNYTKLILGHSRSKIRKKVRSGILKIKWSPQRPPSSGSIWCPFSYCLVKIRGPRKSVTLNLKALFMCSWVKRFCCVSNFLKCSAFNNYLSRSYDEIVIRWKSPRTLRKGAVKLTKIKIMTC